MRVISVGQCSDPGVSRRLHKRKHRGGMAFGISERGLQGVKTEVADGGQGGLCNRESVPTAGISVVGSGAYIQIPPQHGMHLQPGSFGGSVIEGSGVKR